MLSGVGPKDHLEQMGIPCLQDLPVGKNLQDHLTFVGLSFTVNASVSLDVDKILADVPEYLNNGTGPLTSLGGVEGIGYIRTPEAATPVDQPDIELLFIGGTLATDFGLFTRKGKIHSIQIPIEY